MNSIQLNRKISSFHLNKIKYFNELNGQNAFWRKRSSVGAVLMRITQSAAELLRLWMKNIWK